MVKSEWKQIKGAEEGWLLSNEGEATSPRGRVLKLQWQSYAYYTIAGKQISLSKLMRENWRYEWIKELEEGEEAKPLTGHSGYFITNRGRLWSEHWQQWNTPYLSTNAPGYYWRINFGHSSADIHTLVGREFLTDYREGLLILHRSETLSFPQIVSADNLYVGTQSVNNRDCVEKGRWSGNKQRDKHGRFC